MHKHKATKKHDGNSHVQVYLYTLFLRESPDALCDQDRLLSTALLHSASQTAELDAPAAADEDATVSGEVEDASVRDAIVNVEL